MKLTNIFLCFLLALAQLPGVEADGGSTVHDQIVEAIKQSTPDSLKLANSLIEKNQESLGSHEVTQLWCTAAATAQSNLTDDKFVDRFLLGFIEGKMFKTLRLQDQLTCIRAILGNEQIPARDSRELKAKNEFAKDLLDPLFGWLGSLEHEIASGVSDDVPTVNVEPPPETGLPPGVDPSDIKDQDLRAKYEAALEKNRKVIERQNKVIEQKRLHKQAIECVTDFVKNRHFDPRTLDAIRKEAHAKLSEDSVSDIFGISK